ncbi:substrate-binding domain-containing protein [Nocardioides sp. BP30]|uniref:substrate-binding domain-containing protein n=1 Tax=Nocardioides sp. BP30 TaxID=3036374 RepID=UPI002468EF03|nr:substrate-binding domain-containing protein [Nocardioides sp. BP30]WGL52763.1 substrate-binding domain-containing protein [Nocardioides sp. BP30]
MSFPTLSTLRRIGIALAALVAICSAALWSTALPAAHAASYPRLSGDGSSWAGNALNDWVTGVKAQGVTVDFNPDGSSQGRANFANGLSDYAVSEIPYKGDTADPQDQSFPGFGYGMLPVVAGGTSFMYNVQVNGKRLTTLDLSQAALAKIFSGQVTQWNDPIIKATNPGVNLPAQRITVVVRSDGSGATAEFTLWMKHQFPADYAKLCAKTGGCNASSATSYFPYQHLTNFVAQSGSNGVTTYTASTPYTINYDEYSYARGVGFPVAQVQNAAGFYTVPSDTAVAVALTQAKINQDKSSANYLSQDLSNVYAYKDPRTYPISAYSYLIVPTVTHGSFDTGKGSTLAYFGTYALCEGQRTMGALGYSPLPMNLVLAAMDQVSRIPGIDAATASTIAATKKGASTGTANPCDNPTFKPGDSPSVNQLVKTAPFPAGCDAACQAPWTGIAAAVNDGPGTKGGKKHGGGTTLQPTTSTASTAPTAAAGTGAGTGTGPAAATTGAPAAVAASVACDPDTGICSAPNATGDGTQLVANPTVIDGSSTWGPAQAALILSGIVAVLLIFAPPVVARALDVRRRQRLAATGPGEDAEADPDGDGSGW